MIKVNFNYYLIIPILGYLRDASKNKEISFYKFIRTPIINYLIYLTISRFNNNKEINILLSIIFERIFFLVIKTIYSFFYYNEYKKNKPKYQIK